MLQRVKESSDVRFKHPLDGSRHYRRGQGRERSMRATSRPKAIRCVQKIRLVDRLQEPMHCRLEQSILHFRDTEGALFLGLPRLGNVDPTDRLDPVGPGP